MKKQILFLFALALNGILFAQTAQNMAMDTLPYREIPTYPDSFTAENVAARMVDGLGFRYYWATEGLRPEDLAYRPTPEARSSEETIDHILGLATILLNSLKNQPNVRSGEETSPLTFEVKRQKTLEMLKEASDLLKQPDSRLEELSIVQISGDTRREFPFWNMLNGPIADALWHIGQVVTFRRSSGNPFNSKANVFTGKIRE
jgi:hypothetical protein